MNSRGAREIYSSLNKINKVKTKDSKGFSGRNRKFKRFFRPKRDDLRKEKGLHRFCGGFSGRRQVISKKNRPSSQKRLEIRCQSKKNTNLGLDLHSNSPEPLNFFGAQSALGRGHNFCSGGTAPVCPPWHRVCCLAKGFIATEIHQKLNVPDLAHACKTFNENRRRSSIARDQGSANFKSTQHEPTATFARTKMYSNLAFNKYVFLGHLSSLWSIWLIFSEFVGM